jgi:hypothetical protein
MNKLHFVRRWGVFGVCALAAAACWFSVHVLRLAPFALATDFDDVLWRVDARCGPVASVPDADGDGLADLIAVRDDGAAHVQRLEVLSSRDGRALRTLWRASGPDERVKRLVALRSRGACEPTLVAFTVDVRGAPSRVEVVCASTGAPLKRIAGSPGAAAVGCALARIPDLDGDGVDELALGARPGYDDFDRDDGGNLLPKPHAAAYVSVVSVARDTELLRVDSPLGPAAFVQLADMGAADSTGAPLWVMQFRSGKLAVAELRAGLASSGTALPSQLGPIQSAGDVDRDGEPDLVLDKANEDDDSRVLRATLISGRTLTPLFDLRYPDWFSDMGVTVPMGDLDGDGHADIGLGEPNFGRVSVREGGSLIDAWLFANGALSQAAFATSEPRTMGPESGCAIVYSGRTQRPIFGVWAPADSGEGLGRALLALPDISGDGAPDVLVATGRELRAYRGPGR